MMITMRFVLDRASPSNCINSTKKVVLHEKHLRVNSISFLAWALKNSPPRQCLEKRGGNLLNQGVSSQVNPKIVQIHFWSKLGILVLK